MINISGNFSLTCANCNKQHVFIPEDSDFDLNNSDADNPMGVRNSYVWEHSFNCDNKNCGIEIEIQYEVSEYPINTFETAEVNISGGHINNEFNINFQEEPESNEF